MSAVKKMDRSKAELCRYYGGIELLQVVSEEIAALLYV